MRPCVTLRQPGIVPDGELLEQVQRHEVAGQQTQDVAHNTPRAVISLHSSKLIATGVKARCVELKSLTSAGRIWSRPMSTR